MGSFLISDDAGTQAATLKGTGTRAPTDELSPLSLSFGEQAANASSVAQTVTLTNTGDVALTLISTQIVSGDFTATNGCGNSLAAHAKCAISVNFVPKSIGLQSGSMTVTDVLRSQLVTLGGTGLAPPGMSLLPSSLTFGATGVGIASVPRVVTLTNNGGQPLQITDIAVNGEFGIVSGTNTCSLTVALAVGADCQMQVAFAPVEAGTQKGSLLVTSNGISSPLRVLLSGTGVDFSFVANGASTVTVKNGGSAAFPLLLTPVVAMDLPVTFTCTGGPANAKCIVTSTLSDLSATTTVTATVSTATQTVVMRRVSTALDRLCRLGSWWIPALALLVPCLLFRRRLPMRLLMVLICTATLTDCGSGRKIPGDGVGSSHKPPPVTVPAGTYPIVVSATSAGLTRSVTVTMVVQ